MSEENAIKFLNQIEEDSTLRQRVQTLGNQEGLLKVAQESGYSFTAEEMKAVTEKINSDELNEQELEAVAGGGIRSWLRNVRRATRELVRDVLD